MYIFDFCPKCEVGRYELHERGCDFCWCKPHGIQLSMCEGLDGCSATTFMGYQPYVEEAIERDWFVYLVPSEGWIPCSGTEIGAVPDRNRVMSRLKWNSNSEKYE